jgi:hypothetical protein
MDKDLSIKLYQTISDSNEVRIFECWHASSIAECPRAHYFKRLGIKPLNKPSAALILRWTAGHLIEEAIRKHLLKIYPDMISNERMTSKKYDMTGEYDNYVPSEKTLIEIKSVHDSAFIERDGQTHLKDHDGISANGKNKWKSKDGPYLHHEIQNHSYVLLMEEKEIFVEHIIYVYISLSGRIVVYKTDVQKHLLDNVRARLTCLNDAWGKKIPPICLCDNKEHPLYPIMSKYCDFHVEGGECCSLSLINKVVLNEVE